MIDDDNCPLTIGELLKIRKIINREDSAEESRKKFIARADSISKMIISGGQVLATIAIAVAIVKGWAIDFILGVKR